MKPWGVSFSLTQQGRGYLFPLENPCNRSLGQVRYDSQARIYRCRKPDKHAGHCVESDGKFEVNPIQDKDGT